MSTAQSLDGPFDPRTRIDAPSSDFVSQTILERKGGSLSILAYPSNYDVASHSAPHDVFLHVLSGDAILCVGERVHEIGAGDAIVLPAHVPRRFKTRNGFKFILAMLKGT